MKSVFKRNQNGRRTEMPRGGARPGAGRPRKPPEAELPEVKGIDENSTPLEYMMAIVNDPDQPDWRRDRMAVAAAKYLHAIGERDEGEVQ
jgi:hypothetical protein